MADSFQPPPSPAPAPPPSQASQSLAGTLTPSAVIVKHEPLAQSPSPLTAAEEEEKESRAAVTVTIPSCSAWFSWDTVHDTERRMLPGFFGSSVGARGEEAYKYYRNFMIRRFRARPEQKLTFTEARKGLAGDVGSLRRVFEFLEEWGLINYTPAAMVKGSVAGGAIPAAAAERKDKPKKLCSICSSICSLFYFGSNKADLSLCANCYVHRKYQIKPGVQASDFRRFEIIEETKSEWTDKETLLLLEAVLHYGEEWKKVSQHVGSRNEKECIARFVKLPFGEQYLGLMEAEDDAEQDEILDESVYNSEVDNVKRRRLNPLADASNPIMAQVAFLSAIAGSGVAKAAARAALATLYNRYTVGTESDPSGNIQCTEAPGEREPNNDLVMLNEVRSRLEDEQKDVERAVSEILDLQFKEIQDEIVSFEQLELLMEKERQQLRHLKDSLYADQLILVQHQRSSPAVPGESGSLAHAS